MGALIVVDVHAKEVVNHMCKSRVDNIFSFEWTKQLRYYWEEDEKVGHDAFAR
jgi:dynein heavy chain